MGKISKNVANNKQKSKYIKPNVADYSYESGNDNSVLLSIKNIQSNYQCFSDWSKTEMSKFWAFNDKLHKMTWNELYKSASKGKDKRGMAYTIMDRNLYKNMPFIKEISKDVTMFELRVDGEIRVHGFRSNSIFYLCLLDREHKISRK